MIDDRRNRRWWAEDAVEPHRRIHEVVTKLRNDGRRQRYEAFESIYAESTMSADTGRLLGAIFGVTGEELWQRTPVIRSAVDTQMNRLGRVRPRPRPMTRGGDWESKERSRLLDLWLDGWFERLGMHDELGRAMLKDGLVLGLGAIKGYEEFGSPKLELVHPGDLHVDKWEERHNLRNTLYQTIAVDREVLWETYPDHRREIELAGEYTDPNFAKDPEAADLVLVVEAWRRPTGRDEDGELTGGRHLITIDQCVLNPDDTTWAKERFPFAFYRYRSRPRSFWGLGLVESAGCMQADLNEIDDVLAEAYRLMTPAMMVRAGSVPKKTNTNKVGRVIEYTDTPPTPWNPDPVSPGFLQRGADLESRIMRMEGISPFSSQSMKPAGLNSGVAIEAHEDIESERHALPAQAYEQAVMDVGELLLEIAEEIADDETLSEKRKLDVLGGRKTLELVSYDEARLPREQMVMRVWPVSRLSRSVSGRLEQVDQMREMGLFPNPDDLLEVLDLPDTDSYTSLRLAGRRLAEQMVANALRDRAVHVHPYMDLDHLLQHAASTRSQAELDGAPEAALLRLDDLIGAAEDAQRKLAAAKAQEAAAAAPPPQPGIPSAPMGPPGPVPPGMPALAGPTP